MKSVGHRVLDFMLGRWLKASVSGGLTSEKSGLTAGVDDQEQHPDTEVIPDSGKQRRRATLAYFNNDLVRGIVDSEVRQTIGSLTVQARTGNSAADKVIETAWYRLLDAGLLEDVFKPSARHLMIDGGDVLRPITSPVEDPDFEIVPYRRIKTPYDSTQRRDPIVRDGFGYDARGKLISAYVEREESSYDSVYALGQCDRIPLFAHPVLPRLAGQTKGLSWFCACIQRLEMVNRWMNALLASAELHAAVVALIRAGAGNANAAGMASGFAPTSKLDDMTNKRVIEYARKHRFLFLPDGADYKIIQANAPVIAEFLVWSLRFIARALGVSFERLTYDLTHTSFSSTKFGDRDDRITVLEHQGIVERHALKPANRLLLASLILRGELRQIAGRYASDPVAMENSVYFALPGRPPVDEFKAEQANELALTNRTASRTCIAAERGRDAEDIEDEIIREDQRFFEKRKQMWLELGFAEDQAKDFAREDVMASKKPAPVQPQNESDGNAAGDAQQNQNAAKEAA